jgi:hypothetical protein
LTLGRSLLVGLIAVATAELVIGVVLERNTGDKHHSETSNAVSAESNGSEAEHTEEGAGEGEAHAEGGEAEESHNAHEASGGESDATVLGVDLESTPFVILAALASVGLAAAAWARPGWLPLLVAIGLTMAVFAALDVREVAHQLDENRDGLALLAGVVAALHLSVVAVATAIGRRAQQAA